MFSSQVLDGPSRHILSPGQMLYPTNASRLESFDARLATGTELRSGSLLSAAMDYADGEVARQHARQEAKIRRATCKQLSLDKCVGSVAPQVYKPNKRGGKNTKAKCTACNRLRKGSHKVTGCPFQDKVAEDHAESCQSCPCFCPGVSPL